MSISNLSLNPSTRRAVAAGAVILAVGALALVSGARPVSLPDLGEAALPFSGPGVRGSLALSQQTLLASPGQPLFAEIRVASIEEGLERERTPLCLALVLDTSGSMQGDKLQQAKHSVMRLVESMRDDDEIALVRYTDHAELLQPLRRVGQVRSSLRELVLGMGADGGTNIPAGLSTGLAALQSASAERVKRLVLVSDGLDSSRPQSESLARSSGAQGLTISTLGIGLDFDEAYLGSVARLGRGNFAFVQGGRALEQFLDRELNETATTTIRNVIATLRLPAALQVVRAIGAEVRHHEGQVEIEIGSLFAGDERRVALELTTDAQLAEPLSLDADLRWVDRDGRSVHSEPGRLDLGTTAQATIARDSQNPGVRARCLSALASWRNLEAAQAYANGDLARADAILENNLRDLRTAASTAPAAEAAQLESQIQSYEQVRGRYAASPPQSDAGRAAAKAAVAEDNANLSRSTY